MPERILLADDHVMVREGLATLLGAEGFEIVGTASDGREAVRLATELKPDFVLLDLGMPQMNGLDATRAMIRSTPATRVIILTMHPEGQYVTEALRAGARGYVLKTQATTQLVRAIGVVREGAIYVSPGIAPKEVSTPAPRKSDLPLDPLTAQEREVLRLISEGKSSKEIAAALNTRVRAVESCRANIMEKLKIHEIAGLVRYAIRRGLIVP